MPQLHHLLYQEMRTDVISNRLRPPLARKLIIIYVTDTVAKAESAISHLAILRSSTSSPFLRVFSRGPSKYSRVPFHAMIRGPTFVMLRCILDLSISIFSLTAELDRCLMRLASKTSRLAIVYLLQTTHILPSTVISASNLVI